MRKYNLFRLKPTKPTCDPPVQGPKQLDDLIRELVFEARRRRTVAILHRMADREARERFVRKPWWRRPCAIRAYCSKIRRRSTMRYD